MIQLIRLTPTNYAVARKTPLWRAVFGAPGARALRRLAAAGGGFAALGRRARRVRRSCGFSFGLRVRSVPSTRTVE